MRTYYELFMLRPKASRMEVEAAFRRFAARYRPTEAVEQVFGDQRFRGYVNAYLTLEGPLRSRYDELLKLSKAGETPALPAPLEEMPSVERVMLMARVALWRREFVQAIRLLRSLLERESAHAPGWALLGEVYFSANRLPEGIAAYEHAVGAAPQQAAYAKRLQQARLAADGRGELPPELSPEEQLLREERRRRWRVTLCVGIIGFAVLVASFLMLPIRPAATALFVPWLTVGLQLPGMLILLFALAYGRLLPPFERAMVWSGIAAGDRGSVRNYPYGLVLLALSAASLWLALAGLIVMAIMDEEWPVGASVLVGLCAAMNVALVLLVRQIEPTHWTGTMLVGGNLLVLAGMLGWWFGSFGAPTYD